MSGMVFSPISVLFVFLFLPFAQGSIQEDEYGTLTSSLSLLQFPNGSILENNIKFSTPSPSPSPDLKLRNCVDTTASAELQLSSQCYDGVDGGIKPKDFMRVCTTSAGLYAHADLFGRSCAELSVRLPKASR